MFQSRGATNVKFVWCVNDNGASTIESVWPGNSYVDYTAIDQYNFGTTQSLVALDGVRQGVQRPLHDE